MATKRSYHYIVSGTNLKWDSGASQGLTLYLFSNEPTTAELEKIARILRLNAKDLSVYRLPTLAQKAELIQSVRLRF